MAAMLGMFATMTLGRVFWLVALLLIATCPGFARAQALPVFSNTGPDAAAYGENEGYPIGTRETLGQQHTLVGAYSHFDQIRVARVIPAPARVSVLNRAPTELALTYEFEGKTQTLASYLERNPATGLLILRDRTIQFEHYRYARTATDRFTSQSMAKTIVAMLVGIAIEQRVIASVDDTVQTYVGELTGTEIGRTKLRDLLHMASGMRFHEVYDGRDDITKLSHSLSRPDGPEAIAAVAEFNGRVAEPGTVFSYASLDTEALGLVLARATGKSLSDLVARGLWAPIGAEAPASWTTDAHGQEVAYCCFNAVLRDWGRIGILLANDGVWDGAQVIPRQWLLDATTVQAPFLAPGVGRRPLGYGYQTWLLPGETRQFALRGVYGQTILVDPASKLVLVHTAARPHATKNAGEGELMALWQALVAHHGS